MRLQEELLDVALSQYDDHYHRKNLSQIEAESLGELQASALVGFGHELIPAPAIAGAAEQAVDERTDGQQVIADNEVFKVHDAGAFTKGLYPRPGAEAEDAGHDRPQRMGRTRP